MDDGYAMIDLQNKIKGYGVLHGHAWCVSESKEIITLEISEDISLSPEHLPLVGYGCGGWLFKQEQTINIISIDSLLNFIVVGFSYFKKNQLTYLPSVTGSCSDL